MEILNKIIGCIFATKASNRFSVYPDLQGNRMYEQDKVNRKIKLLKPYLEENNDNEFTSFEIHKIIKKIEGRQKINA